MTLLMLVPLLLSQAEPPVDSLAELLPPIRPATEVQVSDFPNDEGHQLVVRWKLSPDDKLLDDYILLRSEKGGEFQAVAVIAPGTDSIVDDGGIANFTDYAYKVAAVRGEETIVSDPSAAAQAAGQWFHIGRINVLVAMIFFFSLVAFFISQAKQGKNLFLRKIAGLEAIDEAVGRATEMGRPILFVPGLSDIRDIATIAALNILQGIAKKAAQYDTPIIVPNKDPIVYTVAREIVKEAYSDAGRPDAFNPDSVFFVTQNQFAYVAAVNGIMLREKPATNFFLGMFYAESLLLAETGNISGAIQIAGTDASAQLPFFITACDYTIIGEELYAASAYLSREPNLVGTIKAQDWGKATIGILLIVLTILALFGLEFATKIVTSV
ncbi:MAG: DUF6754 domain-containing protein [candidate division WOR-3 bacterium]|nr:DUF6754 domain-containing protein [candidate division WOR-3 bacterium]